jgi:formamidopyrimidine-DNA glycosylase
LRILVEPALPAQLQGKTIVAIGRIAKYIQIALANKMVWLFHLGMTGKLIHVDPATPQQKHDHMVATLDNGRELRYHDPRRFGLSLLVPEAGLPSLPQLRHLGLDPFDHRFNGEYLFSFARCSVRRIRDLLLDQQIVGGIGNIYANEILFRAAVRPTVRSHRLPRSKVEAIAALSRQVLNEAIHWCGTSFSDYRDAEDRFGEFQNHLSVYDRAGEPCRNCSSAIKRVVLGNRSVFYCPSCQK